MPWGEGFKANMAEDFVYPRYILESVAIDTFEPLGGTLALSSHAGYTGYVQALVPQGMTIRHGRLQPGSWRRSFSSASFAVAGWFDVRQFCTRGTVVQLMMGFDRAAIWSFQRVFVGVVRNVVRRGNLWFIDCVDLIGALTSRFSDTGSEAFLFHSLGDTTSAAAYVPLQATLSLTSATGFGQSTAGAGEGYLVEVTPNTGDVFYLRGSLSGTTLTITHRNIFGTTESAANAGNQVRSVAFSQGHALNIARSILLSTGTAGQHGTFDFYPASWSYGIPEQYIDAADIEDQEDATSPSSGANGWTMIEAEEQSNGLAWLESFLSPGAFFLSMHEGRITARAVRNPNDVSPTENEGTISYGDVVEVLDHQAWSSEIPAERINVRYQTADSNAGLNAESDVLTRPVLGPLIYDLTTVWTNGINIGQEVLDRMSDFDQRIPEHGRLLLRGWKHAGLSPGSIVTLDIPTLLTARTLDNIDRYQSRRCLVIGGGPNWFGATTEIEFLALPVFANEG